MRRAPEARLENSLLVFFPDARATVDDGDPCLAHASFMLAPASIRMGSLAGEYLTALWIRLRKTTLVSERSQ